MDKLILAFPIKKSMRDPNFKVKAEKTTTRYGKFIIEPLEEGFGHTLGNSLRRVLLSAIKGAAITSVKIDGVKHQFSTLPGMKEDIVEFILNVKKIRLQIDADTQVKLTLSKRGVTEVFAGDLSLPAGVTVINPDLYLATLSDKKAKLEVEFSAQSGYGYETADQRKSEEAGVIMVDSIYNSVTRVNYRIEATRVGRMTNLDKLVLEIWTDGVVSAESALQDAAKLLASYFLQVYEPKAEIAEGVAVTPTVSDEILKMRIEELDIPTRIANSLANGGIETVGQLLGTPRNDLLKLKNLGGKSLSIIEEKLRDKGVALSV